MPFRRKIFFIVEPLDVVVVIYDSYPSTPPLVLVGSMDKNITKFADDTLRVGFKLYTLILVVPYRIKMERAWFDRK